MKNLLICLSLFCSISLFSQKTQLVDPKYTVQEIMKLELPNSDMKIRVSSKLNDKCYIDFDEETFNDPFGFGAYDIKMKLFLTPKIDYVQRVFITGLTNPIYFFMIGINRKF
jgi:hypothetical protein